MYETVKLPGSTKSKITKDEDGKNLSYLDITEVLLFIAIFSTMIVNMIQESYTYFFQINRLDISSKSFIMKYGLLIRILNH